MIAPNKTITKSITEIFFAKGSNLIVADEAYLLNNIPNITGTVTIKNISRDILSKEIFSSIAGKPNKSTDVKTISGMLITHIKLIIAVRDIERATSPFAKEVNIFDVTPPGAAAMIITPIAISGAIDQIFTKIIATIGSRIICEIAPIKKSFGCFIILRKSLLLRPKPNTNIIKARAKGKITSVTMFIKK
tara:strand:- start:186 stop:755 length:570 start_codon:yes stop_codon:yes gene_type:complete